MPRTNLYLAYANTVIKEQTFFLKKLPVRSGVHNEISSSAVVCALIPPWAPAPRQQGDVKQLPGTQAGTQHIPQLQGALPCTENVSEFLLGHLRQGKYVGCQAVLQHTVPPCSPKQNTATQNLKVPTLRQAPQWQRCYLLCRVPAVSKKKKK